MTAHLRLAGLAGLLVLLGGCADDDDCEEPLEICDIASADCREHVFVQTACARGHEGRTVPPVQSITRSEFEDFLRAGDEPTAEQQRLDAQRATALRMLALLPPGEASSDEAAIAAYAASVLAFYSRTDGSVTIVETNLGDVNPDVSVFVLSHEFVHAQQDVDIGLQEFFDEHATSADASTATRSVTEGEAVHYSNLTMARQPGAEVTEEIFEAYYAEQQQDLRDAAAGASSTAYTDLSSTFPYPFGGELVTDRWLAEGNAGVRAIYDDPPGSTAAILRTLAGDDPRDEVDVPALLADPLPEGWAAVADDTLGAWILYALARRSGIDGTTAEAMAEDWAGDRILVVGGSTGADVAVAWTIRFFSEASAQALTGIEAVPPPEGVRSVRVQGRDVTMVLAVDADALTQWEGTFQTAATAEASSFRQAPAGRLAPPLPPPQRPHPPHWP
ncbi:MAG: hypothetical protein KDK70_32175 [Myxococcales bacterium]|nr:hypothetical protein [Myxococcales bacterium]